jgi:hypothetical protein
MKMKTLLTIMSLIIMTSILSAQSSRYGLIQKNTIDGAKVGIQDKETGHEIIPAIYDKVVDIGRGKFGVIKESKVGVVDTTNKIIIPAIYSDILTYMEDRTFISNGKKWALVDDKGKILTQFLYDAILGYQEGIGRVNIGDKTVYINSQGGTILTCKCEESFDCTDGLILIYAASWESTGLNIVTTRGGKEVRRQSVGTTGKLPIVFNKKGIVIYEGEHEEKVKIVPIGGKIVVLEKYIVSADKTYDKVVDNTGKVIIPYEKAYTLASTDNWLKIITLNQVWSYGILSFNGEILLKPNFSSISDYTYNNNQLAKVTFPNGGYFYIDKAAKCIEFDKQKCPE